MHPDYYRLLGVPSTATQPEIRSAYLALARRHHPDVNRAPGSADYFRSINAAYEVLGDPERRATYDSAVRRVRDEAARQAYEARMRAAPPPKPSSPPTTPPAGAPAHSAPKDRRASPPPTTIPTPNERLGAGRFLGGAIAVIGFAAVVNYAFGFGGLTSTPTPSPPATATVRPAETSSNGTRNLFETTQVPPG